MSLGMAIDPRSRRTRKAGGAYMTFADYSNATQEQANMKEGIVTVSSVPLGPQYRHDNAASAADKIQLGAARGANLTLDDKMMAFTTSGGVFNHNGTKSRRITGPKGKPAVFSNFAGLWAPSDRKEWVDWIASDIQYAGQVHGFVPGSSLSEGDQTAGQYPAASGGMDISIIVAGKAPIVNNSQKTFAAGDIIGCDMVDLLESAANGSLSNLDIVQPRLTHADITSDDVHPLVRRAAAQLAIASMAVDDAIATFTGNDSTPNRQALVDAHVEASKYSKVIADAVSRQNPEYAVVRPIGVVQSGAKPNGLMSMLIIPAPQ